MENPDDKCSTEDIEKARKYIIKHLTKYTIYMYENTQWFGDTEEKQKSIVRHVKKKLIPV